MRSMIGGGAVRSMSGGGSVKSIRTGGWAKLMKGMATTEGEREGTRMGLLLVPRMERGRETTLTDGICVFLGARTRSCLRARFPERIVSFSNKAKAFVK